MGVRKQHHSFNYIGSSRSLKGDVIPSNLAQFSAENISTFFELSAYSLQSKDLLGEPFNLLVNLKLKINLFCGFTFFTQRFRERVSFFSGECLVAALPNF